MIVVLDDHRHIAWCALAGAVAFPVASVIALPGMAVLGCDPGPFSAPFLVLFALWGALAGGGLGLGLRDPVRSPALAAQGAVGFMAAWIVGWATRGSVTGAAPCRSRHRTGPRQRVRVVGAAGGCRQCRRVRDGARVRRRDRRGVRRKCRGCLGVRLPRIRVLGGITGMAVGEGELGRRQGRRWAAWPLPASPGPDRPRRRPTRRHGALSGCRRRRPHDALAVALLREQVLPEGVATAIFTGVGRSLTGAVADLDGDGDGDVARSAGATPVLENSGGAQPTLGLGGLEPVVSNPTGPVLVTDLDADGDRDLGVVGSE